MAQLLGSPDAMLSLLSVLAVLGLVYSAMSPETRRRLGRLALEAVEQVVDQATRSRPDRDRFREALRGRTRWAVLTPALVGLSMTIYFLMVREAGPISEPETIVRWGGNFWLRTRNGEWLRLVTSVFVHTGFVQLLVNMIGLAQIGAILERLVGRVIVVAVFLTAGVFASLVNLTIQPLAMSFGASGAICGLYGLLLASAIWGIRHPSPVSIPLTVAKMMAPVALVFLLYNVVNDSLSLAAELTGLLIGLTWGAVLAKGVNDLKPAARRVAHLTAAAMTIAVFAAIPLRGATDVRPELERTAAIEDRTAGTFRTAAERFRSGRTSADALAQLIDKKIVPELELTGARLAALVGVPDEHRPLVAAAEDYVRLRVESWRLRSEYIRKVGRVPAPGAEASQYRTNNRTIAQAEMKERAALESLKKFQN